MSSRLDAAHPQTVPGTPHFRPAIHYTARKTWLNDPNGLVFFGGFYHLYYQNNPYDNVWGNMSWAHATSTDLVHWTEHGVAIPCDEAEDIYSGSIVVDRANTSGFGTATNPPLVAVYTSAFKDGSPHRGTQAQSLAYSNDGGMTWSKYAGNPVLSRGTPHFRDPKVFEYSGPRGSWWVMVVVEAQEQKVVIYRSTNLRDWEPASEFGPANAVGGESGAGEWECPDLFPLAVDEDPANTKWVLVVNLNPGAVAGGSGGQYFVGDFDGVTFAPDPSCLVDMPQSNDGAALRKCLWLDWGRDYYAAVSFSNVPDNRRLMIGWLNNWDYANSLPTDPWRSGMSLVREVRLETIEGHPRLVQMPILPAAGTETEGAFALERLELRDGALQLPDAVPGMAQVIDVEVLPGSAQRIGFRLLGASDGGAGTILSYDTATGELTLDRRNSGNTDFHPKFASVETAPVVLDPVGLDPLGPDPVASLEGGALKLRIVVDHCSVEVFAQGGRVVMSDLVFPDAGSLATSFFVDGGKAVIRKLTVSDVS
ncbi:glycoside hydrolase family 32 protein [Arthrobacter sp. ISL-30]|uniref:glycoside hydrolase family 32 protein n=1 Tax=Arthrobacter sp. ISL-30 TaxID=2819109 RepID=UPI001BE7F7E4|nr:glycoside hydrolase family 32 protein [Arthrobacter sp. ISL-30]MBT2515752.1 glycoside hydrolase family 32 protein [Arthrobacter sp. ISL-30]